MEPYPAGKVTDDPLEGQPQQWPEEAVLPEYKGVMSSYFKVCSNPDIISGCRAEETADGVAWGQ